MSNWLWSFNQAQIFIWYISRPLLIYSSTFVCLCIIQKKEVLEWSMFFMIMFKHQYFRDTARCKWFLSSFLDYEKNRFKVCAPKIKWKLHFYCIFDRDSTKRKLEKITRVFLLCHGRIALVTSIDDWTKAITWPVTS